MGEPTTGKDLRADLRVPMHENVTVQIEAQRIVGPGENISAQGVFFVTEGAIPVTVRIAGVDQVVRGELVRVQTMGEGRTGIAVRFLTPAPADQG